MTTPAATAATTTTTTTTTTTSEKQDETKSNWDTPINLYSDGFGDYFESGRFSDVEVVHVFGGNQKNYKCHKVILTFRCPYFKKKLEGDNVDVVSIEDFEDPDDVFPKVLQFIYSGNSNELITSTNAVSMGIAAEKFELDVLGSHVDEYLGKELSQDNVFEILDKSLKNESKTVTSKCVEYLAINFEKVAEKYKSKIEDLPRTTFFDIIGHKRMKDANENRVTLVAEMVHELMKKQNIMDDEKLLTQTIDALVNSNTLTADDATMFLAQCDKLGLKKQAAGCAQVLAANFYTLQDKKFIYELSASSFCSLLRSDELFVKSEDSVYEIATEYIEKNSSNLSDQEKHDILSSVRITFLSIEKLRDLKENPPKYISIEEIIEALWVRIGRLEQDADIMTQESSSSSYSNLKPRKNRAFFWTSDFDKNGIMYWLGTGMGAEKYVNPHLRGVVTVTHSANPEVGKAHDLISYDPARCNLVSKQNTTVTIMFHQISVLPTKYTLRHTMSRDAECLRNWKFQASKDGTNFVDLKSHVNDAALTGKGATHTWALDPSKANDYYTYFRILQDGNNSSNNTYFSLAGFEVYGIVRKLPQSQQSAITPRNA